MTKALLFFIGVALACAIPASAADPIRVMLLDGESGGTYHNWMETTPYLKRMLEDTGVFKVDVVTARNASGDFSNFKPKWSDYQAVVLNYDAPDARWNDDLRSSFEQYVKNGGGVVSVHAADNAFPNWKEFNLMIGIGGWRGRNAQTGPHFYFKDGKLTSDTEPGPAGNHGARLQFKIVNQAPTHPIVAGLAKEWMHVKDELYDRLRGPGENMTVISTAFSDPANRGSGKEEPILMVLTYGKGRIFHTVLGHDIAALNSVGFVTTYQRGTEWAATGKVTQKAPADFPSADNPTSRKEYEPPAGWVSGAAQIPGQGMPGRGQGMPGRGPGGPGAPGAPGQGTPPGMPGRGPAQQ